MAEPASSAAGGGILLWKTIGGVAIFAAIAAFFAAIVSMCMMTPRTPKEWAVGLISTVASSLGLGALAVLKMGLLENLPSDPTSVYVTLVAIAGIAFACGLPGWAFVRAIFTWLAKRDGKDIGELVADAKEIVK